MRDDLRLRIRLGFAAGACALLALGNVAHAQEAQKDDEDTFEQRIIKGILGGMGVNVGGSGIQYRERSPLVIPPSMDLPPPTSSAAAALRDPAWPKDPERKKGPTKPVVNTRATPNDPGTNAALTPSEMRRGTIAGAGRISDPSQSGSQSDPEIGRAMTPTELGTPSGSIFNWRALTGNNGLETARFEGEPARGSLTQPPPGYQTPSPNQPYGANTGGGAAGWTIPNVLTRPEGVNGGRDY
ncbi:MAG TPA: hypothetical protein VK438_05560 [Xanthobacteraceae bacterium]|nr:hypothetical protein [Xanthobacteraceae bacterium]